MTVRLIGSIRISGVVYTPGVVFDWAPETEAAAVHEGWAEFVPIGRFGVEIFGPGVTYAAPTVTAGNSATIVSSGLVDVDGEQWLQVVATGASGGGTGYMEIRLAAQSAFTADSLVAEFKTSSLSSLSNFVAYLGTTNFAVFATDTQAIGAPSTSDRHFGHQAYTWQAARFAKTGFSGELTDQAWTECKLRLTIAQSASVTVLLRSIRVGVAGAKGRLAITFDDGYKSVARLAMPILAQYGLKVSMGIIADQVGNSNYMTTGDLARLVALGHECLPHGPIGGTGNLFENYAADADRLTDMRYHRDWLKERGLSTPAAAACYVWPQGRFSDTAGDTTMLVAAQRAGFVLARAATVYGEYPAIRAMSPGCLTRLTLPIIGHSYAGVSNTADDATETTNIAAITTRITELGAARTDGVLMLHEVVARGAASNAIHIEADRLRTLCAAIRTAIDAGSIENVLFSQIAT